MPKRLHISTSIKAIMLFAVAFATLTISSCKKDGNEPAISISAKVDGTATLFNTNVLAFKGTANSAEFTNITGTAADGTSVTLTIYGALAAGKTYSASTVFDGDGFLIYTTKADETYMLGDGGVSTSVSITVNSVEGNKVSGTFTGTLQKFVAGSSGATTLKSVTEGKFSVTVSE
jgi:hypothetical protein